MKPGDWLRWHPRERQRIGVLAGGGILLLAVDYVHVLTGLAYELHILFILPVLLVSWFAGAPSGYGLALLAVALWLLADLALAGTTGLRPLVFNTGMRLAMFLPGVWLLAQLRGLHDREARLAREDMLTGLPNRREFAEQGRRALALAQRLGSPFTTVFIDLDHFKKINDQQGHEAGDAVLANVAATLKTHLRVGDIPGRLGGDEFALLLPGMDAAAAAVYLKELRRRLLDGMRQGGWPVTFSIGAAAFQQPPQDLDPALAQADTLMYQVKTGGRDAVLLREVAA